MRPSEMQQKTLVQLSLLAERLDALTEKVDSLEKRHAEITARLEHLATVVDFVRDDLAKVAQQLWGNGDPEKGLVYFSAAQRVKAQILRAAFSAVAGLVGGLIALLGQILIMYL